MNTKQKGARKELLCAKELASRGYFIAFRSFTVKRGPCFVGVDFGDCIDVVALKSSIIPATSDIPGYKEIGWRFISCSYASHRSEKIKALTSFKEKYEIFPGMVFEVWLWTPARYRGRGAKKHFEQAKWEKIVV